MDRHQFVRMEQNNEALINKLRYLKDVGLKEYEQEALSIIKCKRLPKLSQKTLVQKILYKTLPEKAKRESAKDYYIANIKCFLDTTSWLLNASPVINLINSTGGYTYTNCHELFRTLLCDAVMLLQSYEHTFLGISQHNYQLFNDGFCHPYVFYRELHNLVFQYDPFWCNHKLYLSMLREMIELRIRWAFDIFGKRNSVTAAVEPIAMNMILLVLKQVSKERTDLEFSVPLVDIERIYSWANLHVHTGLNDYVWKNLLILKYVHPLMCGAKDGDLWDVDLGISAAQQTFDHIREVVTKTINETKKPRVSKKKEYTIISIRRPAINLKPDESH